MYHDDDRFGSFSYCPKHGRSRARSRDPTSTWLQSEEAPLFSLEDLENLEGQAAEDMGESAS
jgi:hypothetical protein